MSTTDATLPFVDRRRHPAPASSDELLQRLPSRIILDRMSLPILGLTTDGVLTYTNSACAAMLGYDDVASVLRQPLCALLSGYESKTPQDCIVRLREAVGTVVDWVHAEGFVVRSIVSEPLLLRATDPLLIFSISDITDVLWADHSRARNPAKDR